MVTKQFNVKKWKRYREGGAADAVRLCLFVSNL